MGFLNTNTAIERQLMRTARMLEAELRQVLRGSVGMGTKEDESSTGRVWAVGVHHVNTLRTGDAKMPFNTCLVFTHLITQYMERFLIWSSGPYF
jgi:hypothetical protein